MPIEYPGGGVVREHTAVRTVGRHLRRLAPRQGPRLRARARRTSSTPAWPTTWAGSTRARRSTPCAATSPAASSTTSSPTCAATTTSSSSPTPPTPPRSSSCSRPPPPRASTVENLHEGYGVIAVQGTKSDEVLEALGLPTGHEYMSFVETDWNGHPVIVCRTGYTGERGYELVPAWEVSAQLWDALLEAAAPLRRAALRPGRPRHAAHRDGLRPARQRAVRRRSPPCRPGSAGRSAGRRTPSGASDALVAEKAAGPAPGGLGPARHRPRHPARALRGEGRTARSSARSPRARSARPSRTASRSRCSRRRSPRATRSSSTCAAARCRPGS